VTQTQAMPGYVNKLYHTFTKPGKYQILCMEYCGAAHHFMVTEFEVLSNEDREA
jgi:cytochrome c oxidase subunit 2